MATNKIQLLETFATLVLYAISFFVTTNIINNSLKNTQLQRNRRKIIIKAINFFIFITVITIIAGIWGLDQNEIAVFASTIFTALGIAFFAQWSLLSNITSSILLFFNHPLKVGDTLKVMDKDCPFEGEIVELSYFFIHIQTQNGETITIPNALIFQKSLSIIDKKNDK